MSMHAPPCRRGNRMPRLSRTFLFLRAMYCTDLAMMPPPLRSVTLKSTGLAGKSTLAGYACSGAELHKSVNHVTAHTCHHIMPETPWYIAKSR